MQELYREPVQPELVTRRICQIRDAGVISCASVTPQRTEDLLDHILAGELDMLVIQGTVVSAEHVSTTVEPLNLKTFIRNLDIPVIVGGCATYKAALGCLGEQGLVELVVLLGFYATVSMTVNVFEIPDID